MRLGPAALAIAAIMALAGCSVQSGDTEPESAPSPSPSPVSDDALPDRADMDQATRIIAEAVFKNLVSESLGADTGASAVLVAAGDGACDAMDRGDSVRSVLIVVAGMMPTLKEIDDAATIAGAASGTLCPEHTDYTDAH